MHNLHFIMWEVVTYHYCHVRSRNSFFVTWEAVSYHCYFVRIHILSSFFYVRSHNLSLLFCEMSGPFIFCYMRTRNMFFLVTWEVVTLHHHFVRSHECPFCYLRSYNPSIVTRESIAFHFDTSESITYIFLCEKPKSFIFVTREPVTYLYLFGEKPEPYISLRDNL